MSKGSRERHRRFRAVSIDGRTFVEESAELTPEDALRMDTSHVRYAFADMVKVAEYCITRGLLFVECFTCAHCGARETIPDLHDHVYATGRCEECHEVTDIVATGGAILAFEVAPEDQARFKAMTDDIRKQPDAYDLRNR